MLVPLVRKDNLPDLPATSLLSSYKSDGLIENSLGIGFFKAGGCQFLELPCIAAVRQNM